MAELLLFHHAHGLTAGVLGFAEELRAAGHVVHVPDLYDGETFADRAEGVGHALHMMDADRELVPPHEDLADARRLAQTVESVELFVYSGDRHLFADTGLPDYDERAATLLKQRVLGFLAAVG
jgi:dienelactone hydrolase